MIKLSKCLKCANIDYCKYIESNDYRSYCWDFEYYVPKEEDVRQEERAKIIKLLKSDLETLDKNSKHYNNFKEYIESTIELLEKEK